MKKEKHHSGYYRPGPKQRNGKINFEQKNSMKSSTKSAITAKIMQLVNRN